MVPKPTLLSFDPIVEAQRQWVEHGWVAAAEGMAAITSVMRAHQIFLARVDEQLRPLGLSFARYEILMLLALSRNGSLPLGKIGQRLQLHPARVTSAMDRLQLQKYVRREPHPSDRRTTLAAITRDGRSAADQATDVLNCRVFVDLGVAPAVTAQIIEVLTELRKASGDFV